MYQVDAKQPGSYDVAVCGGILVGNELGAGRLAEAREYGMRLSRIAIVSGLVTGGVLHRERG